MKTITRDEAKKLIHETGGRVFSAIFVKKDGTDRKMNCRLGVRKGVKGVGRKFNPADYDLIGVFDMQKDAHRMINIKTLRAIQINKQVYTIYEEVA